MGWSGGTFSRVHDWTTDEGSAINIEADRMDAEDDNFRDGINDCLHKGGQNTASGDLPMGGYNHTAVGNATALDEYASASDVIDQDLIYYVDSGAADAYVITPATPAISAYEEGQRFVFRALAANTGASTLNVNALGVKTIETMDGNDLVANMIITGGIYEVTYDANGSRFVLTSPNSLTQTFSTTDMIAGTGMTGGGTLAADRTFNVIGGTGITANDNDIQTNDSEIVLADLSGYDANDHIDHTAVSVIAGTGLTGGGTIAADRTLNVIGGDGITANADDIALSATVAGDGLTHSSGVLAVGSGSGITVTADAIALTNPKETKFKTANENKTTDDTLADDNHLAGYALAAGTWYSIKGWLDVTFGTSAGGLQCFLQFSDTPVNTGGWSIALDGDTASVSDVGGIEATLEFDSATETTFGANINGSFLSNAGTGGTLDFQWAQLTSNATPSSLLGGSYISIEKIG